MMQYLDENGEPLKTTSSTPENEKLSTLEKGNCGICRKLYNKRAGAYDDKTNKGMICLECYQSQLSEPKEVVDWEIEFDEKFKNSALEFKDPRDRACVKSFIKTLLSEEKQKWKQEMIEWCENNKRDTDKIQFIGYELGGAEGYNEALDNLINKLKT